MHTGNMDTTPLSRLFEAVLLFATFVYTSFVIDAEWMPVMIAIGGSLSGAVALGYFRRDSRKFEQLFKVLAAAISGSIIGAALATYLNVEQKAYLLFLYFCTSFLSLTFMKSLLSQADNNIGDVIRGLIKRVFNLQLKEELTRKRVEKIEEKIKSEPPA